MWSLGCLMAEMISGKPLFPGISTMNQLERILHVTGQPSPEDVSSMQSKFTVQMLESLTMKKYGSLAELLPNATPEALDLLSKMLQFNPEKRITATSALEHVYFAPFVSDEETRSRDVYFKMYFTMKNYSAEQYRIRLEFELEQEKRRLKRMDTIKSISFGALLTNKLTDLIILLD